MPGQLLSYTSLDGTQKKRHYYSSLDQESGIYVENFSPPSINANMSDTIL